MFLILVLCDPSSYKFPCNSMHVQNMWCVFLCFFFNVVLTWWWCFATVLVSSWYTIQVSLRSCLTKMVRAILPVDQSSSSLSTKNWACHFRCIQFTVSYFKQRRNTWPMRFPCVTCWICSTKCWVSACTQNGLALLLIVLRCMLLAEDISLKNLSRWGNIGVKSFRNNYVH